MCSGEPHGCATAESLTPQPQVWPKSCGHVKGKRVIPRDEAVARVRAACDARCILHPPPPTHLSALPSGRAASQHATLPGQFWNIVERPKGWNQQLLIVSVLH